MDIKGFAGKPLAAVIDEICSGVTGRERWAAFEGWIELSGSRIVSIGGDFMVRGGFVLYEPERPKTQSEIEKEAYAKALQPFFEKFSSGELVMRCRPITAAGVAQEFDFPADRWEDPWKIVIEDKRATLGDEMEQKYKLLAWRLSGDLQQAGQAEAPQGTTKKGKGGRPQEYNWSLAEIALTSYFNEEGTPMAGYGEQVKAERFMAAWFERTENGGKAPTESLIRDHVTKVVEILERERKRPKTQFPAFPADKKR